MASAPRVGIPIDDPRTLRAIAHPVRNRILEELSATGPARAADLARDLGIPANQASFHLRQLAKYGIVEEAPEAARDRRDRVWKVVVTEGYTVDLRELQANPDTRAASAVWQRTFEGRAHETVRAVFEDKWEDGVVRSIGDRTLRLTQEEGRQLWQELTDVADRWADQTRGRDPGHRSYILMTVLQPHSPLMTPPE